MSNNINLVEINKYVDGYERHDGNPESQKGFAVGMLRTLYPDEMNYTKAKESFFGNDVEDKQVYQYFKSLNDGYNQTGEQIGKYAYNRDTMSQEDQNKVLKNNAWFTYNDVLKKMPEDERNIAMGIAYAEGGRTNIADAYVHMLLKMPEDKRNRILYASYLASPKEQGSWFVERVANTIVEGMGDTVFNFQSWWKEQGYNLTPANVYDAVNEVDALDENGNVNLDKMPEIQARLNKMRSDSTGFWSEKIRNAVRDNQWTTDSQQWSADTITSFYKKAKEYKDTYNTMQEIRSIKKIDFDRKDAVLPEVVEDAITVGADMAVRYALPATIVGATTRNPMAVKSVLSAIMFAEFKPAMYNALRFEGNLSEEDANKISTASALASVAVNYVGYTNFIKAFNPKSYLLSTAISEATAKGLLAQGIKEAGKKVLKEGITETTSEYAELVIDFATKAYAKEYKDADFDMNEQWDNFCQEFWHTTKVMPVLMLGGGGIVGGVSTYANYKRQSGAGALLKPTEAVTHQVKVNAGMAQLENAWDDVKTNTKGNFSEAQQADWINRYKEAKDEQTKQSIIDERTDLSNEKKLYAKNTLDNTIEIAKQTDKALAEQIAYGHQQNAQSNQQLINEGQKIDSLNEEVDTTQTQTSQNFKIIETLLDKYDARDSTVFLNTQQDLIDSGYFSQEDAKEVLENLNRKGFYVGKDDKVYLLSSHFKNGVDAFTTFFHEHGHRVIDKIKGSQEYTYMMDSIVKLTGGENALRMLLPSSYANNNAHQLAEEYLMKTVERVALEEHINEQQKTVWQRFKKFVKNIFEGDNTFTSMANKDIATFAKAVLDKIKNNASTPAQNSSVEQQHSVSKNEWSASTPENNATNVSGKWAVLSAMLNPQKRDVIERLLDDPQGCSSVINALMSSSSKLAKLTDNVEYDLSQDLSDAVEAYVNIKTDGDTVDNFLKQEDFTRPNISAEQAFLLKLFEANNRTPSGISGVLNTYYDLAKNIDTTSLDLFGDKNPDKIDLLNRAFDKYATDLSQNKPEQNINWKDTTPSQADIAEAQRQMQEVKDKFFGTPMYMKAPNGADTKLTEEQWLQVRTPNFKKWFGDWETLAEAIMPEQIYSIDEAYKFAKENLKGEYTNRNGFKAVLSGNSIDKMNSGKARAKTNNNRLHALALANIGTLFKKSELLESENPRDLTPEIKEIHRFYAPILLGIEIYAVKITVKEFDETTGNRLYSIEGIDIQKESELSGQTESKNSSTQVQNSDSVNIFFEKLNNVKQNSVSKVVDENGEPLVLYHGTENGEFFVFDKYYTRSENAFFFTDDLNRAKEYAGEFELEAIQDGFVEPKIQQVFLKSEKPLIINCKGEAYNSSLFETEINKARQNGNDSVIFENVIDKRYNDTKAEAATTYAAFNPNQIKSATDNVGTFDGNNNDMRWSVADESLDTQHKELYERYKSGDIEALAEAQRLVDDVAEARGYNNKVYHGTGSDGFNVADASSKHEENGEGAQSFGSGLYMAESRGVAEAYRDSLKYSGYLLGNVSASQLYEKYGFKSLEKFVLYVIVPYKNLGGYYKASQERDLKTLNEKLSSNPKENLIGYYKKQIELTQKTIKAINKIEKENLAIEYNDKGTLFNWRHNLKDDEVFKIDEDFATQAVFEKYKKAWNEDILPIFKAIVPERDMTKSEQSQLEDTFLNIDDIRTLFSMLEHAIGSDTFREIMLKHGIKGVKYLDGVSRNKGEGKYNYVSFEGGSAVKLQDPFTLDDSGELVPISQRFNVSNEDMRWSIADGEGMESLINLDISKALTVFEEAKNIVLSEREKEKNSNDSKFDKEWEKYKSTKKESEWEGDDDEGWNKFINYGTAYSNDVSINMYKSEENSDVYYSVYLYDKDNEFDSLEDAEAFIYDEFVDNFNSDYTIRRFNQEHLEALDVFKKWLSLLTNNNIEYRENSSNLSDSEYIKLESYENYTDNLIIRFSDHRLPSKYGITYDFDIRSLDSLEAELENITEALQNWATDSEEVRKEEQNNDIRWSIASDFGNEINQYIAGTLPKGHVFKLGNTPKVMRMLGIDDLPIELSSIVLEKKENKHGLNIKDLKALPFELENPIAIIQSKKHKDSKIILTEIPSINDNTLVAVVRINAKNGTLDINKISSVYNKENSSIQSWVNDGFLLYANTQKKPSWLKLPSLQLHSYNNNQKGYGAKVLTEKDLLQEKNKKSLNIKELERQERTSNPVTWASIILAKHIAEGKKVSQKHIDKLLPPTQFDGSKQTHALNRAKKIAEQLKATKQNYQDDLDLNIRQTENNIYWQQEFVQQLYQDFSKGGQNYGYAKAKLNQFIKDLKQSHLNKIKGFNADDFDADYVEDVLAIIETQDNEQSLSDSITKLVSGIRQNVIKKLNKTDVNKSIYNETLRNTYVNILKSTAKKLSFGNKRESIMKDIAELEKVDFTSVKRDGVKIDSFSIRAQNTFLRIAKAFDKQLLKDQKQALEKEEKKNKLIQKRLLKDQKQALEKEEKKNKLIQKRYQKAKKQALEKINNLLSSYKMPAYKEIDIKRQLAAKDQIFLYYAKKVIIMDESDVDNEITKISESMGITDKGFFDRNKVFVDKIYLDVLQTLGSIKDRELADIQNAYQFLKDFIVEKKYNQELQQELQQDEINQSIDLIIKALKASGKNVVNKNTFPLSAGASDTSMFKLRLEQLLLEGQKNLSQTQIDSIQKFIDDIQRKLSSATFNERLDIDNQTNWLNDTIKDIYKDVFQASILNSVEFQAFDRLSKPEKEFSKFSNVGTELSISNIISMVGMLRQEYIKDTYDNMKKEIIALRASKANYMQWEGPDDLIDITAKLSSLEDKIKELDFRYKMLPEMEKVLTKQDYNLLNALSSQYNKRLDQVNKVQEIFGGLPIQSETQFYMPVERDIEGNNINKVDFQGVVFFPSYHVKRRTSLLDINENADVLNTFYSRTQEDCHFINWAQLAFELSSVFGNEEVSKTFRAFVKQDYKDSFFLHLRHIISGKIDVKSDSDSKMIGTINSIVAHVGLWWNVLSGVRQTTSIFAFGLERGISTNIKDIINPDTIKYFKEVWDSPIMQNRRNGEINQILKDLTSKKYQNQSQISKNLKRIMLATNGFAPSKYGDSFAICLGASSIYAKKVKEYNLTLPIDQAKKLAMEDVMSLAELTQQSPSIMNMSSIQRTKGAWGKLFTTFRTSPQQFFAYEYTAVRKYIKNPSVANFKEMMEIIIINHVLLPVAYNSATILANILMGDDFDDQDIEMLGWSMLTDTFAGWWASAMLKGLFATYAGVQGYDLSSSVIPATGLSRILNQTALIAKDARNGQLSENISKRLDGLAKSIVPPYRYVSKIYKNATDQKEGALW